jgi:hypothetical protein
MNSVKWIDLKKLSASGSDAFVREFKTNNTRSLLVNVGTRVGFLLSQTMNGRLTYQFWICFMVGSMAYIKIYDSTWFD